MQWKRFAPWLLPVIPAVGIKIFSFFPDAVEKYYSNGLYPFLARLLRFVFGWIPFSAGDIFYAIIFIYLLISIIRFFKKVFQQRLHRQYLFYASGRLLTLFLWIYVVFNFLWGLNYDRPGIAQQMHLESKPYSTDELKTLMSAIVFRINALDSASRSFREALHRKGWLFAESADAYRKYAAYDDSFYYRTPSVKPSLFSYLGNYFGIGGYYNPFTGEAQVNTTIPVFTQPFTTCHEIGHQLGYAKEEEANFAGFLTAKTSSNPAFRYSVYVDLYLYAGSELYVRDSTAFIPYRESLKPTVRQDLRELKTFYKKYENPFEPVIRRLYGDYLRANRQPQGMNSYDEVVGLAVAYYNKFGREAF
ncbi:MAG: DUF3810 domain-containing protein [Bacteroidota bacterium]|nr:DUF3810 domain-containing protein [Bacteroidota bacterium]